MHVLSLLEMFHVYITNMYFLKALELVKGGVPLKLSLRVHVHHVFDETDHDVYQLELNAVGLSILYQDSAVLKALLDTKGI